MSPQMRAPEPVQGLKASEGRQAVPEGQKSLAVEVTLQPSEKSYGEEDLKAIAERVVAAAGKLGAVLRG